MNERNIIPVGRAILWILVTTLLITGSTFMGWLYYLYVKERRLNNDQYRIVALVQSTSQTVSLKSSYLAEILDLSFDCPVNLDQFNVKEAQQLLLANPLIKEAVIKKILPGTIYVHYEMRTPHAFAGEFANTVIDKEGILFPFHSFFTPKRLPTLFFGMQKGKNAWGVCLKDHAEVKLAFDLMEQFQRLDNAHFILKNIDVSSMNAGSFGHREVILTLEGSEEGKGGSNQEQEKKQLLYLRLNPDRTWQDLVNFSSMQKELDLQQKKIGVIDFRIPRLAFISYLED